MISFAVHGLPIPQGSMKATGPRGGFAKVVPDNQSTLNPWRDRVGMNAREAFEKSELSETGLIELPVAVSLSFFFNRDPSNYRKDGRLSASGIARPFPKRPDLDKLVRAILDALTGSVLVDDGQVIELHAKKQLVRAGHGVTVKIVPISPEQILSDQPFVSGVPIE